MSTGLNPLTEALLDKVLKVRQVNLVNLLLGTPLLRPAAARQVDGLQTGDILDFSYTRTRSDPVLQGHSFDAEGMASLPPECRAEPKLAFDGGADGLDLVRRILEQAAVHLTPQGWVADELSQ